MTDWQIGSVIFMVMMVIVVLEHYEYFWRSKRKKSTVDKSRELRLRRTPNARQCHVCSCCGEYIPKGSIYYAESGLDQKVNLI